MSTLVMSDTTSTDDLAGQLVETDNFGEFTVVGANQAPELSAVAISGRDALDGHLYFGFLPYGTQVRVQ